MSDEDRRYFSIEITAGMGAIQWDELTELVTVTQQQWVDALREHREVYLLGHAVDEAQAMAGNIAIRMPATQWTRLRWIWGP